MTDEHTSPAGSHRTPARRDRHAGRGAEEDEKLNQTVEINDIGPCKKHIKVTVDRDDIDKRLDEKFSELVEDAVVPGFRPGKAPRKIVERRFQKEVADQVKWPGPAGQPGAAGRGARHRAAQRRRTSTRPRSSIPEEGPFVYEFDVEVRPQFDLPNYKGLKLKRPVADLHRRRRRPRKNAASCRRYGQLVPKDGRQRPRSATTSSST